MAVYSYVDTLPQPINQGEVVNYFATRPEGALLFTQPTLSCKLKHHLKMEVCMHSNPNALSSKRLRIITRPDVDHALWLWVQHKERLGNRHNESEWNEPLDSVLRAEDNIDAALAALDAFRNKWAPDGPSGLCEVATITNEHKKVEEELLDLLTQLKDRRCINGQLCTLDEVLDPEEEREIGEIPYGFGGGDAEIVGMVQQEMELARVTS